MACFLQINLAFAQNVMKGVVSDGEDGRKKIVEITRYLTIALGLLESATLIDWQKRMLVPRSRTGWQIPRPELANLIDWQIQMPEPTNQTGWQIPTLEPKIRID